MGEDQGWPRDIADLAGAEGDVLERPPAAGEQGKAAFAQASQGPLESVARPVADIEFTAAAGLADRDVDADAGTLIAGIGQGSQPLGGGAVERGQGVGAGGGDVVHRARLHGRDPPREPAGGEQRLDIAAVRVRLAGIPQVDNLALTPRAGSLQRLQGMILPSRITWAKPSSCARARAWRRSGASLASTSMTSSR